MNPLDEVFEKVREINLAIYGIDIYPDQNEVEDKYQGLSPADDIFAPREE